MDRSSRQNPRRSASRSREYAPAAFAKPSQAPDAGNAAFACCSKSSTFPQNPLWRLKRAARSEGACFPDKKKCPRKLHPPLETLAPHLRTPETRACEYFLPRHTRESAAWESPAPLPDLRSSSATRTPRQSGPALQTPSTLRARPPPPPDRRHAARDLLKAPAHPGSRAEFHIQWEDLFR